MPTYSHNAFWFSLVSTNMGGKILIIFFIYDKIKIMIYYIRFWYFGRRYPMHVREREMHSNWKCMPSTLVAHRSASRGSWTRSDLVRDMVGSRLKCDWISVETRSDPGRDAVGSWPWHRGHVTVGSSPCCGRIAATLPLNCHCVAVESPSSHNRIMVVTSWSDRHRVAPAFVARGMA